MVKSPYRCKELVVGQARPQRPIGPASGPVYRKREPLGGLCNVLRRAWLRRGSSRRMLVHEWRSMGGSQRNLSREAPELFRYGQCVGLRALRWTGVGRPWRCWQAAGQELYAARTANPTLSPDNPRSFKPVQEAWLTLALLLSVRRTLKPCCVGMCQSLPHHSSLSCDMELIRVQR